MSDVNRTYAEAVVCRWAEKRMDLPSGSVASVRMAYEPAWCSDATFERETLELTAYDENGQVITRPSPYAWASPITSFIVDDVAEAMFELLDIKVAIPVN